MTLRECYESMGADYDEALRIFMSEARMEKYLMKFLVDPTFPQLQEAIQKQDIETAFRCAHTLKGVSLNLGMKKLARVSSDLTEYFRPLDAAAFQNREQLAAVYHQVKASYEETISTSKQYLKDR